MSDAKRDETTKLIERAAQRLWAGARLTVGNDLPGAAATRAAISAAEFEVGPEDGGEPEALAGLAKSVASSLRSRASHDLALATQLDGKEGVAGEGWPGAAEATALRNAFVNFAAEVSRAMRERRTDADDQALGERASALAASIRAGTPPAPSEPARGEVSPRLQTACADAAMSMLLDVQQDSIAATKRAARAEAALASVTARVLRIATECDPKGGGHVPSAQGAGRRLREAIIEAQDASPADFEEVRADDHDRSQGGETGKYVVLKADGSPTDPKADYVVLRVDTDPEARLAVRFYGAAIHRINPSFASDLWAKVNAYARRAGKHEEECAHYGHVAQATTGPDWRPAGWTQ